MREIRSDVTRWFAEGKKVALAQVAKTWGSSPRVPGSVMAVSETGGIAGSVSGGCIEGAVVQVALGCLRDGAGSLEEFHASTRRAQEVGLSCGGSIDVLVAPLDPALFAFESALIDADCTYLRLSAVSGAAVPAGSSFLVAGMEDAETAIERLSTQGVSYAVELVDVPGGLACCAVVPRGSFDSEGALDSVLGAAEAALAHRRSEDTGNVEDGRVDWFFSRRRSQPQLVCIGGVHVSIHLCRMAKTLGYRTVVVDPRGVFATSERFPFVDELVHEWPQRAFERIPLTPETALCALTHDPKIDVPALARALDSRAFYVGSLGRASTQLSRYRQLRGLGYADEAVARVFGPIGLDLRGREPAEIALSIMAEITAVRHGGRFPMSTMLASARAEMGRETTLR